jgi:lipase
MTGANLSIRPGHEELDVPVAGGRLRVLRWGTGPRAAIAVHGITASAACWQPMARALPRDWTLFAVDLRGRGHSAALPGPYGLRRHVEDLLAVLRHLGHDSPVLVGHSLGAYISLLTVVEAPGSFGGLLLVDGGIPMPVPDGADLDAILTASLGPALARLKQTYPTVDAYLDFWRTHPALSGAWNADIEDYLRYDLTGQEGALRSRVLEEAARCDGRELLASGTMIGSALRELTMPVQLLTAPAGLFGQPPGMLPTELCQAWQAQAPMVSLETLRGTNHYTIIFDPDAAATVAQRLTKAAT